ncbi:MAG: hypothetical protein LH475_06355 [Cryobacterium sp.]|uniref:hypothetical protein n=1 Tax=unclassified Cryobacterium TaxID=2649013 RepID=UPI0018CA816B|nr:MULTISPECIES: hypothetical protein [unclassified Cryobacterium]MCY7404230.1 hypothetical protein [Cryobacterium sp.]
MMGNENTLRNRILVAQTMTAVCAGLPGARHIAALAAGWSVTSATGSISLCYTVADIWIALFDRRGAVLQQALKVRALAEEPGGLAARVVTLGLHLARQPLVAGPSR